MRATNQTSSWQQLLCFLAPSTFVSSFLDFLDAMKNAALPVVMVALAAATPCQGGDTIGDNTPCRIVRATLDANPPDMTQVREVALAISPTPWGVARIIWR
jgi:hypothetical protein